MTSMAFAFLCFTGVFVMFLYLMRSLEKFQEHMRNEHARLRVLLRALEARLDMPDGAVPRAHAPDRVPPPGESRTPLTLAPQEPLDVALDLARDAALDDPVMRFEPKD